MKVQKPLVPCHFSSVGFCYFPTGHAKNLALTGWGQGKTAKISMNLIWNRTEGTFRTRVLENVHLQSLLKWIHFTGQQHKLSQILAQTFLHPQAHEETQRNCVPSLPWAQTALN